MTELDERFRGIDRLTPPDLLAMAQAKVERGSTVSGASGPTLARRFAIIAASLAIGLAAVTLVVFAFRQPSSGPAPVDGSFTWPDNACGLVTVSEVEEATDSTVTHSGLLTDDQLIVPEGPNPCRYETDDEHASLTVGVRPDDVEAFNRVRDVDPANVEMLSGLGDEAFSTGGASVWVRIGSGYFVISSQHGAGDAGSLAELRALARLALGSPPATLLVSTSGPSGDTAGLSGTLTIDEGCVAVATTSASSVYVVWPAGYSLADEDGASWLIDDSGNRVAALGDQIQMGGGITNLAHAEPSVQGGIPTSCAVGGTDAYWFAGTPELADGPSTPDPPAEEHLFVPPTTTEGSTTTLPLVFPDGSRADLTYPAELLLAERGIAPNLLIHLSQGDRCGWDGVIGYGSLRDTVYEGDGPTFSVDGESSHVEVWEGARGYLPQYLVIRKGLWELTTPCPRASQVEEEATAWADHIKLTTSPEGYLVVKATDPLVVEGPEAGASFSGPELYFLGGIPGFESGATGILSIGVATRCPEGEGFRRQPGWARGCFQGDGGAVIITIQTDGNRPAERAYLDSVVDGVAVTDIAVSSVKPAH